MRLSRNTLVLSAIVCLTCASFASAAVDDRAWRDQLMNWRAEHAADLQKPERWLSLIGLEWLKDGDNRFGSDKSNDIQIKAKIPAQVGVVHLDNGKVTLKAPAGGFPKAVLLDG